MDPDIRENEQTAEMLKNDAVPANAIERERWVPPALVRVPLAEAMGGEMGSFPDGVEFHTSETP